MKAGDMELHVTGKSRYVDDISLPPDTLFCALRFSGTASGIIERLDTAEARAMEGIKTVLTAADIPGENQIGGIIPDEELMADKEIRYIGQPVAAVYADTENNARKAAAAIRLEVKEHKPVLDPREAFRLGRTIGPPRTFKLGDPDAVFKTCAYVCSGRVDSGGQEHFYLEGQAAVAFPVEGKGIRLLSSTQSPTAVQKITARVLGLPMHQVEVEVGRLGGGFGGKEDQATAWAVLAALGAYKTGRPVKLTLRRSEDLKVTGKRHPYSSDFTIGLDTDGKVLAYKVFFYQNSGAAADLSPAILERSLFHATGSYFVPHVEAGAVCCKTNIAPFTAFRGFGGPQAMFVFESALFEASRVMGAPVENLQELNLLKDNDEFSYGMRAERCKARTCFSELRRRYDVGSKIDGIRAHNRADKRMKKGYAFMPVCFGISFTNTTLNQGGALVHVYLDGSVSVSTGAVEMGQGVNRKIADIAAAALTLPLAKIKLESTDTTRVANTSPTAASTGSDLNGMAAQIACEAIAGRLSLVAVKELGLKDGRGVTLKDGMFFAAGTEVGTEESLSWEKVVAAAYINRVDLSAEARFATPDIYFDKSTEKGRPFAYHTYGSAFLTVTVDTLLGIYTIDEADIVHDSGTLINRLADLGQVEGGLAQGLGWMTVEELEYSDKGVLSNGTAGTYKLPDLYFSPAGVQVLFLEDEPNPCAVLGSKAVGEPPFMYGIGVYFALLKAAMEANPDVVPAYHAPMTTERLFNFITQRKG